MAAAFDMPVLLLIRKKANTGIAEAKKPPKIKLQMISELNALCANSCPPLNPMDNKRYSVINLDELSGIFRSLLS